MPLCCACFGGSDAAKAMKENKDKDVRADGDRGPLLKVYVTRNIHEEAIIILRESFDVEVWNSDNQVPREKLLMDVKDAHAIICTIGESIDVEVLQAAGPNLKVIASMTSGLSHIDTTACEAQAVTLFHTADLCADVCAELTCALLLLTARKLMQGYNAVKEGGWGPWKPMWLCGPEFQTRTLGILGLGRVGMGVAKRFRNFKLGKVIYYDTENKPGASSVNAEMVESAEELVKESHFIVCCMGLTSDNHNIINAELLSNARPDAIFINTARAELVNQDDLVTALKEGTIAAAGLDVTTPEPLPPTHELLQLPNCVVLPHMGTATVDTRKRMAMHLANQIIAAFR